MIILQSSLGYPGTMQAEQVETLLKNGAIALFTLLLLWAAARLFRYIRNK
jgi:hypothetical protein